MSREFSSRWPWILAVFMALLFGGLGGIVAGRVLLPGSSRTAKPGPTLMTKFDWKAVAAKAGAWPWVMVNEHPIAESRAERAAQLANMVPGRGVRIEPMLTSHVYHVVAQSSFPQSQHQKFFQDFREALKKHVEENGMRGNTNAGGFGSQTRPGSTSDRTEQYWDEMTYSVFPTDGSPSPCQGTIFVSVLSEGDVATLIIRITETHRLE